MHQIEEHPFIINALNRKQQLKLERQMETLVD